MPNKTIEKCLQLHSVKYDTINGKIIAYDYYTIGTVNGVDFVDVTGYSKNQLLEFLGY
jgi:hypothetical protein